MAVRHKNHIALGADGQATLGHTVVKSHVKKIRRLLGGKVLAGFAGGTADAFTLLERLEEHLKAHHGQVKRAVIELAKAWRTDRYLRKLEAMIIVVSQEAFLVVSGTGDVLEPDQEVMAIGSGSMFAQAAALAFKQSQADMTAEQIVRSSLGIAADICIYTNHNIIVETLELAP